MKRLILICAIVFGMSASYAQTSQGAWPNRPVKIISGLGPGSSMDLVARTIAPSLSEIWGQPVVVENKTGAAGNVAATYVAGVDDDHTILIAQNAITISASFYPKLGYNLKRDLKPITQITSMPLVLIVNKDLPVKNLKEFIELLKKNPGKFNYASAGNGSSHHLAGEQFKMLTKTFITHIPYRGAGPAMQDLIAGQVDIEFDGLGSSAAQIKNGSIVALAVASQKRAPGFPSIPTAAEAGLVGYEVSTWYGLFAPKGTPQPIVDKMIVEVQKAINTPEVKAIWTNNGSDTPNLSGDAFGKFVAGDIKRWAAVAKASGAKLD